jgi:hypothetical protein
MQAGNSQNQPSSSAIDDGIPPKGTENDRSLGISSIDESAFYQAEIQMLTRESQMLRHRIRELGEFPVQSR